MYRESSEKTDWEISTTHMCTRGIPDSYTVKKLKADARFTNARHQRSRLLPAQTGDYLARVQDVLFDYVSTLHLDYQEFSDEHRPAVIRAAGVLGALEARIDALAKDGDEERLRKSLEQVEREAYTTLIDFQKYYCSVARVFHEIPAAGSDFKGFG